METATNLMNLSFGRNGHNPLTREEIERVGCFTDCQELRRISENAQTGATALHPMKL